MITVLLAAWNGEAYIEEQLDSILGQDGLELNDLRVVISDDGSTDRTRAILEDYHALKVVMIGITKIPQKKLLTPWIISNGRPVMIQEIIPLKLNPNMIACAGAYRSPYPNP